MNIDSSNIEVGRRVMMHAAFFYYQLLEEGEFSCGQTSYWLMDDYTVWEIIDMEVTQPEGVSLGIDQTFIREAGFVFILCMLSNYFSELEPKEFPTVHGEEYLVLQQKGLVLIPEISLVLKAIRRSEPELFYSALEVIFNNYVKGRFARLCGQE